MSSTLHDCCCWHDKETGHDNETGTTARSSGPEISQSKPKAVVGEDEAVLTPRAKPRSRK